MTNAHPVTRSGPFAALRSLVRRWIIEPEVGSVDPALGMHLRRLNAFTLILGSFVPLIALKRYAEGAVVAAAIEISAVVALHALRLIALRWPTMRMFRFAGGASIALGMWIIVGTALVLGQLESPSLLYLGLLPLAGGYYSGPRGALTWGLAACGCIVLVGITQLAVAIPPEVPHTTADAMSTLIVVLLTTTGFAYTAQRGNERHLRELAEREDRIRWQAAELTAARDAALEASRVKSAFLANTSHEIRTPMAVIIGMTEMALDADLEPTVRDQLERVRGASLGLLAIINDLLDLSKIEAGKMEVDLGPITLRSTLDELATLLRQSAEAKGLALSCRLDPAVPALMIGDGLRLRQVLLNLVGNAIKFTDRGEVALDIDLIDRTASTARVRFSIRDTGIGIPADRQAAIFDSFTQVDGDTTRLYGGTGLGLAISRQLVDLMGGELFVASTVGEGSTFSFTLPFEIADADAAVHAASDTSVIAAQSASR
jgi:signal transduction histidine kinase